MSVCLFDESLSRAHNLHLLFSYHLALDHTQHPGLGWPSLNGSGSEGLEIDLDTLIKSINQALKREQMFY